MIYQTEICVIIIFMNYIIEPFNIENIYKIVETVKPMWTFCEWEESFRNFYAERIIRDNLFYNNMNFQLLSEETKELLAIIFFWKKTDTNDVNEWILKNWEKFDENQKNSVRICSDFLETMESKVHALMNDDDIKLSLFVSLKKGEGSVLFNNLWQKLKNQGYKNMYLWTDCECNWQWYIKNGFTLVEEGIYEKFSSETEKYKTYIFKKAIL